MRLKILILTGILLASLSCTSIKRRLFESNKPVNEQVATRIEEKKLPSAATPIKEVEEKLVPNSEGISNPRRYFVIIGSFRNQDNALEYQKQIITEGFRSEILKNEMGLYRVSVLSTDDVEAAREDIRRIRSIYPKYFDTWLLIQKK